VAGKVAERAWEKAAALWSPRLTLTAIEVPEKARELRETMWLRSTRYTGSVSKPYFWTGLIGVAVVLAGCANTGNSGGWTGQSSSVEISPEFFLKQKYCPPVEIRSDTSALRVFERNRDEEPEFLRYQASLGQPARECVNTDGGMSIKLGLKGRVVAGLKGGPGTVNLPIRIVVLKQSDNSVLFSQLYTVPVSLTAPTYAADFSHVFNAISFPLTALDNDLLVYAGFDQDKNR